MIDEEDIMNLLLDAGRSFTADELAVSLNVSTAEIYDILYRMEDTMIAKSRTNPPYWGIRPLEDQILSYLSKPSTDGYRFEVSAHKIAADLQVTKTAVNSILYRLRGSYVDKTSSLIPQWYLIEKDEIDEEDEDNDEE